MIIKTKVKPNSSKQEIKQINEKYYEVSLKNPPKDNKANIELIKLLKKHFKKQAKIVKGAKSKRKIIKLE